MSSMPSSTTRTSSTEPEPENDKGKGQHIPTKLREIHDRYPLVFHNTFSRKRSSKRKKDKASSSRTGPRNTPAPLAPRPATVSRSRSFPGSEIIRSPQLHTRVRAAISTLLQESTSESVISVSPRSSPTASLSTIDDVTSEVGGPSENTTGVDLDVSTTLALQTSSYDAPQSMPIQWSAHDLQQYALNIGGSAPSYASGHQQYLGQPGYNYEEGSLFSQSPSYAVNPDVNLASTSSGISRIAPYHFHDQPLGARTMSRTTSEEPHYFYNRMGSYQPDSSTFETSRLGLPDHGSSTGIFQEPESNRALADDYAMTQQYSGMDRLTKFTRPAIDSSYANFVLPTDTSMDDPAGNPWDGGENFQ